MVQFLFTKIGLLCSNPGVSVDGAARRLVYPARFPSRCPHPARRPNEPRTPFLGNAVAIVMRFRVPVPTFSAAVLWSAARPLRTSSWV